MKDTTINSTAEIILVRDVVTRALFLTLIGVILQGRDESVHMSKAYEVHTFYAGQEDAT